MYLFILLIIVFVILLTAGYASWSAAPWLPMRKKDVERCIKLADIKPGDKFYDLGCGDGRLVCAAAQAGADAIGLEISLFPYWLAKIRVIFSKNKNCRIIFKSFWQADLSDADIVYIFLMLKIHRKLIPKFEKELKKGAKIISYIWPIPGWQPTKVDEINGKGKLYLYQR